jgi:hypothetical protein
MQIGANACHADGFRESRTELARVFSSEIPVAPLQHATRPVLFSRCLKRYTALGLTRFNYHRVGLMDLWLESKNAKPLALGFGGTPDNISDRIKLLSSKIKLFPNTFRDFNYILEKRGLSIIPFESLLRSLDECNDFLYDYSGSRIGVYLRKRRMKSPELKYLVPRYVYTDDDIINLEKRIDLQLKTMCAQINDVLLWVIFHYDGRGQALSLMSFRC